MFISSGIANEDMDMEMAEKFSAGYEDAFRYFFNKLYPALKYYAFRILNDEPTSDDAVSTAFERIWDRKDTFTHPKVIKSWLYTTTRNECLNMLQNNQRRDTLVSNYAKYTEGDHEASPEEKVVIKEQLKELYEYLDDLPNACRTVFYMLYKDGKSVRQTAMELDLSISTIKNQKARGLGLIDKWRATGGRRPKTETEVMIQEVKPKTFLEMLNDRDDDAWDKFFESTYKDFYYLFKGKYSEELMEKKVDEAFQTVKAGKIRRVTIVGYLNDIETLLKVVVESIVVKPFMAVKAIPHIPRIR